MYTKSTKNRLAACRLRPYPAGELAALPRTIAEFRRGVGLQRLGQEGKWKEGKVGRRGFAFIVPLTSHL